MQSTQWKVPFCAELIQCGRLHAEHTAEGNILRRAHSGRLLFVQSTQWKVTFCAEHTAEGYFLCRAHSGRLLFVESPFTVDGYTQSTKWKVTGRAQ